MQNGVRAMSVPRFCVNKDTFLLAIPRETLIKSNSPRSNEHTHAAEFDTLRFNQRFPRATPHKDHLLDFARVLLASFPSSCTIRPSKASALRRPHCTILRKICGSICAPDLISASLFSGFPGNYSLTGFPSRASLSRSACGSLR